MHPWGILICILQNKNNKLELSDKIHKRFAIGPTHAYLNLLLNQSSHIKINIILFFTQLEMHFGTQMQTVIAQRQQRITNPCPANDRLYSPNADYCNYIIWNVMWIQSTVSMQLATKALWKCLHISNTNISININISSTDSNNISSPASSNTSSTARSNVSSTITCVSKCITEPIKHINGLTRIVCRTCT